jgi:hypothetical protein
MKKMLDLYIWVCPGPLPLSVPKAIPPAYTEFIGKDLLRSIEGA